MITLNKYFVDQLSQYLSFLNTETSHDDLSELISNLQEILKRRTINNDEIENYRKKIKSLIAVTINTLTPNGIHISTILYFLLIKLAELSPFNEECVKTYMPIPNQKKFF